MKKTKEKKSSGWLHLDPRSKLLILVLFSVVVMIDVVDGPAYTVRVIMTAIDIDNPCGACILFIAAINSLIFVVDMQYHTVIIVGANCVTI